MTVTVEPQQAGSGSPTAVDSQEQLQTALAELMRQNGRTNNMRCCRGEPITASGKRRQMATMLSLFILPILLLVGSAGYYMADSVNYSMAAGEVQSRISFTTEVGRLIHRLQFERDMSALYFSAIGPETKILLMRVFIETDEQLAELPRWPADFDLKERREEFTSKTSFRRFLKNHRNTLDVVNRTLYDEIRFYTRIIDIMQDWLHDTILTTNVENWKLLVAYEKVIFSKLQIGIERALGASYHAKGKFDSREIFEWYSKTINLFKFNFRQAGNYSILVTPLSSIRAAGKRLDVTINKLRDEILYALPGTHRPSMVKATTYFDTMSLYFDALLDIQQGLAQGISEDITKKAEQRIRTVGVSTFLIIISMLMCPIIIRAVQLLTRDIQNCALIIADKTRELNAEQRRTESLVYQMLPKIVAEQLKAKKDVKAEYFKNVTIFFSDIVGFSRISSKITPMEVVTLLNNIYNIFDSRIETHDVYKIETICDSYMVASGLPVKQEDDRHGVEIANMSLDLLNAFSDIEITGTLPVSQLCLRIGIHSGPVVAGVVGMTLPRYCVFGDTVNTASRLETYGEPNRIHISSKTYGILKKTKRYSMQSRGYIEMKGKGKLVTYWLNGKYTAEEGEDNGADKNEESFEIRIPSFSGSDKGGVVNRHAVSVSHGALPSITNNSAWLETSLPHVPVTSEAARDNMEDRKTSGPHKTFDEIEKSLLANDSRSPPVIQLVEGFHY